MKKAQTEYIACKYLYVPLSVVLLSAFLLCSNVCAAFNISVTPTEGGSSLRFGRVDLETAPDKEVRIRITNTESKQYQIYLHSYKLLY